MVSAAIPVNPTSHNVASLLAKLDDSDPDIRFMSLNDLSQILTVGQPGFLLNDYQTCTRAVEGIQKTLGDPNGDVQNMALKCLGPLVNRIPENILCPMIEKISNIHVEEMVDSSISALAVRAIVVALPRPTPGVPRTQKVAEAYSAISKTLIPRLVGRAVTTTGQKSLHSASKGMLLVEMESGQDNCALDLLTEVARCFGPVLQDGEIKALEEITMQVLENGRCGSVMKKKAVTALSALAPYFSDSLLSSFISNTIEILRLPHLTAVQRRLYLTIYGSMARSIPKKFGPYLITLAPFVLAPLSQVELEQQRETEAEADGERDPQVEEVREAALIAIEGFIVSCTQDMRSYAKETLDAAIRFVGHDPNYADDDDEMGGTESDEDEPDELDQNEDYEEDTGFDDEDDVSWKVRRCAVKVIHAMVATQNKGDLLGDDAVYDHVVPALIARFKEREESVRLEVLSTLAYLVRESGKDRVVPSLQKENSFGASVAAPSRKRRRGGSDASLSEMQAALAGTNGYTSPATPPPQSASQSGLAKVNPDIIRGASKLIKTSTVPTKQSAISLLRDLVAAQHGGLTEHADHVIDPVVEAMRYGPGSLTSAGGSANSMKIEALQLLRVVAETHKSQILQPHMSKVIPVVIAAAKDKYSKVSGEALETIETFIKALTPPRSVSSRQQNGAFLLQLYDICIDRISASEADTDVRRRAIRALGLLIGRTSGTQGSSLLNQSNRLAGLDVISERLRNELTRLACVRAIDTIAVYAQEKREFKPEWVRSVTMELGAQLRKANRSLRGASLGALKMIAVNAAIRENLDDATISELVRMLLPLLSVNDLHMLGLSLIILGVLANEKAELIINAQVIEAIGLVVRTTLSGVSLNALLSAVEVIGKKGVGRPLMQHLLKDVGVGGANQEMVGRVIGALLVSGGESVGVSLEDFKKELRSGPHDQHKCLALAVLGEAGLRMGQSFPLKPEDFTSYFSVQSDKVPLAAANALGRAGAGNVATYLPVILAKMNEGRQYLLLHSVKALLQHSSAEADIIPYTKTLWDNIVAASQSEDNKVVGAECIGRLAIIDPDAYLPQLQEYLNDRSPSVRGMVISAMRYTFSDTDGAYDVHLAPIVIPMLTTMLNEPDLENRRLAITTLNSAVHNKPDLIIPALPTLSPLALKETVIRPELVREVTMGPFKHKVDDGLEIRKNAYETLYTLLETAFTRLPISEVYDRVVAGISDEHDIRILCTVILNKLIALAPEETERRLDALAEKFRALIGTKLKDNAVKQELEKLAEASKAVAKVTVLLYKAFPDAGESARVWKEYLEWLKKEHNQLMKGAEEEVREKDR
ncbi:hypothetical protein LTR66_012780 [Elasticomyces elasticus]|nr:hypothetical protein LTR66_012780 [Elasticomyces elasticus]